MASSTSSASSSASPASAGVPPAKRRGERLPPVPSELRLSMVDGREAAADGLTLAETLAALHTSRGGLTASAVAARLETFGRNELVPEKVNPLLHFLSFMWNPLSWVMEVAALVAIAVDNGGGQPPDYEDFAGIAFLLLLNATIGYVEDARAGNAVAALAASLASRATVLRDGAWAVLPAAELVPGDIVHVKLGDVCPADVRVLGEAAAGLNDAPVGPRDDNGGVGLPPPPPPPPVALKVDQAGLTGESLPVDKRVGDVAYSGSAVKSGESPAVVVATGERTFFGKAAGLVPAAAADGATASTTLTAIGTFCVVVIAAALIVEVVVMYAALGYAYRRGVANALVLLIGGVPIAMPTVLSVTSALGARQLAGAGAVVTSMAAVEALAAVDVLVSDKTGTLTTGVLTIDTESVCILDGAAGGDGVAVDVARVVLLAARASRTENADAIDAAVVGCLGDAAAARAGITELRFAPFDPSTKRTAITYVDGSMGGPSRCPRAPRTRCSRSLTRTQPRPAPSGRSCRALRGGAFGPSASPSALCRRGRRGRAPPPPRRRLPRPLRGRTWRSSRFLIRPATTRRTRCAACAARASASTSRWRPGTSGRLRWRRARGSGWAPTSARDGHQRPPRRGAGGGRCRGWGGGAFGGASLLEVIEGADGFAGVFPTSKYLIVEELQKAGHTVAMTGDGVNDAPALKRSHVGFAVSGATAAARAAADVVLTSPGLSVLVDAITGSREVFQRCAPTPSTPSPCPCASSSPFRRSSTFGALTCRPSWCCCSRCSTTGACCPSPRTRSRAAPRLTGGTCGRVFVTGTLYGLYLAGSSLLLFQLLTSADLWATRFALDTPWRAAGSAAVDVNHPQLHSLVYLHTSLSGMALIFSTRAHGLWAASRPGVLLAAAFFLAQGAATLITVYADWGFTDIEATGWGWAAVIWVYAAIWFVPIDAVKLVAGMAFGAQPGRAPSAVDAAWARAWHSRRAAGYGAVGGGAGGAGAARGGSVDSRGRRVSLAAAAESRARLSLEIRPAHAAAMAATRRSFGAPAGVPGKK
nr:PMHA [Bangia fuscopurpurea]